MGPTPRLALSLFLGEVVDEPKPELTPWPFKRTREEIAAAKARRDTAREMYGTRHPEYKKASMDYTRSLQRKERIRRSPSKVRADIAHQMRERIEKSKDQIAVLEKRIAELQGTIEAGPTSILMRQLMKLGETYTPQIMEQRLREGTPAEKWKALQELNDLLKTCYRTEEEKAPKRKPQPRLVVVREWPAEGSKA